MPSSNTNNSPAAPITAKHGIAPLVISMGDPAGIGSELVVEAWKQSAKLNLPPFAYICDPATLTQVPSRVISDLASATDVFADALPILPIKLEAQPQPGQPNLLNADHVIEALRLGAQLCLSGKAGGLVTAPVAKEQLYDAGFNAPGQTEFLADECKIPRDETVMMLAGPTLKVVPVTIHLPLKDVPLHLTRELILTRARTTHRSLQRDFGIAAPRLALCGLNPHAGENGALGREEEYIIAPAAAQLNKEGIHATGPHSADTLFHDEARQTYDAVLSMYHDQGLIPIKTLHFFDGVNATLGLPIVRTSPDHGTAYDIAGKGQADARSMIAAIKMAGEIAQRRSTTSHADG